MSSGGVSASATSLSTCGCHPSGHGDLLGFSFINLFLMISSVRVMSSSGVSSCMDCRMGVSSWFSLVKTLQKKEFSGSKRHSLQAVELSQRTQAAVQIVSNLPAPTMGA